MSTYDQSAPSVSGLDLGQILTWSSNQDGATMVVGLLIRTTWFHNRAPMFHYIRMVSTKDLLVNDLERCKSNQSIKI